MFFANTYKVLVEIRDYLEQIKNLTLRNNKLLDSMSKKYTVTK